MDFYVRGDHISEIESELSGELQLSRGRVGIKTLVSHCPHQYSLYVSMRIAEIGDSK